MAAVTRKGMELADHLAAQLGWTRQILQTCSLICRHATTHHHLMEAECSVEMDDTETARHEARVERLERRITDLVDSLPEMDDGPLVAEFQGDPRGVTVKLKIKGFDRHPLYDGWALEAIMVPQR